MGNVVRNAVFPAVVAVLAACGGGGAGGLDPTPVLSASFSPSQAMSQQGQPATQLWWKYRINGGAPVVADLGTLAGGSGGTVSVTFPDVVLTIEPNALHREFEARGPVTGSVDGVTLSGSYSIRVDEKLQLGSTFFVDERLRMSLDLSGSGGRVGVEIDVTGTPDMPWEWFLDRDDLDTLADGFEFSQDLVVAVTGFVKVSGTGIPTTTEPINEQALSQDTWTVIGQEASTVVLGHTYDDIVIVDRATTGIDPASGVPQPVTIRYWVARGIGFVRADGLFTFLGSPLSWELVDTNLTQ